MAHPVTDDEGMALGARVIHYKLGGAIGNGYYAEVCDSQAHYNTLRWIRDLKVVSWEPDPS